MGDGNEDGGELYIIEKCDLKRKSVKRDRICDCDVTGV